MPEGMISCPLCGHTVTGADHDEVAVKLMEHADQTHGVKYSKADADRIVHTFFLNQHASRIR